MIQLIMITIVATIIARFATGDSFVMRLFEASPSGVPSHAVLLQRIRGKHVSS